MKNMPWPELLAGSFVTAVVATLAFAVRAILTGGLVPRQHLVDMQAERDKWEAAWRLSQETIKEFDGRLDANTEALRLVEQLVNALATKGSAR